MSELPVPKFNIGDTVYGAEVNSTADTLPCPDCGGAKTWKVITPLGVEHTAPCQRCSGSFTSWDIPSLQRTRYIGTAKQLTIGSVRIDTNDGEHPVKYMCNETGVGSGRIWYEELLFRTHTAATRAAQLDANGQNSKNDEMPGALAQKHFSYLSIDDAEKERNRREVYKSWVRYRELREDMTRLIDDMTIADAEWRGQVKSAMDWDEHNREWCDYPLFDQVLTAATAAAERYGDESLKELLSRVPSASPLPASAGSRGQ